MSDKRTISQLCINGLTYDIKDKTSASNEKIDDLSQEVSNLTEDVNNISETIAAIGKVLYPVGSIYLSLNNTNPSTFLGGTWQELSGGYALWSTNDSTAWGKTANAGNTGSTTLKAAQSGVPAHAHSIYHDHPNKENFKVFVYTYDSGNPGVVGRKFSPDSGGSYYVPTTTISDHKGMNDIIPAYSGNSGNNTAVDAKEGHTHTTGEPARIYIHAWKRIA